MNEPENLLAVLTVYRASLTVAYQEKSAANRFNRLQCALRRVLQPEMDMEEDQVRLEPMPISSLKDIWSRQKQIFEQLNVSAALRKVDRGALRNFLTWCMTTPWWIFEDPFLGNTASKLPFPTISLADVLSFYQQQVQANEPGNKATNHLNALNTSVRRYLLLGLGLSLPIGRTPNREEKEAAERLLAQTSCKELKNALQIQEEGFNRAEASASSRKVARSALNVFLGWSEQQPWWTFGDRIPLELSNQKSYLRGHGRYMDKRLTDRDGKLPDYRLRPEEFSEHLQAELINFEEFWTAQNWDKGAREITPTRPQVFQRRKTLILRILGWLHRYAYPTSEARFERSGIPLKELSLERLVPVHKIRAARNRAYALRYAEHYANYICKVGNAYNNWLASERGSRSPGTWEQTWETLIALVKYQYRGDVNGLAYCRQFITSRLNNQAKIVRHQGRDCEPLVDESLWWLDWDKILKNVTEELRYECDTNLYGGPWCSETSIATAYKTYILAGFLTYRASRRIKVFQRLKFLPNLKKRPNAQFDDTYPYLFKDVDGKLKLDLTPRSYKTGQTYGRQTLEIPNLKFVDGKYFYSYIYEWLNVYRPKLSPDHSFFFCTEEGKPYTRMSDVFTVNCHRLTGKIISPHKLRSIYATYYLDQDHNDAAVRSLAWELGNSERAIRKDYDNRRKGTKSRLEQQARAQILEEAIGAVVA